MITSETFESRYGDRLPLAELFRKQLFGKKAKA